MTDSLLRMFQLRICKKNLDYVNKIARMWDNSFVCYNVCQLNLYRENKGIRRVMVASGGGLIKAILVVAIKLVDGGREMR